MQQRVCGGAGKRRNGLTSVMTSSTPCARRRQPRTAVPSPFAMRLSALAIVAVAVAACAAGLVAAQQPPNYGSNLYIKGVMRLPYAGTVTRARAHAPQPVAHPPLLP